MPIEVRPIGEHFGAEVGGIDLSEPLSARQLDAIHEAWRRHLVLVFHGQKLTPAQHIRFGAHFGELLPHPVSPAVLQDYPEIYVLANVIDDDPDFRPQQPDFWHTDITYTATPSRAGILYAREVPAVGGDTLFADMRRAWQTLPEDMKQRLLPLDAEHGLDGFAARYQRMTGKEFPPLPPGSPEAKPRANVRHPAVIRDPLTGEAALFTNGGFTIRLTGMSDAESADLVDELVAHATRPDNVYRHKWKIDDLVMWDNFNTMHMAGGGYELPMRRVMHRLTVGGHQFVPARDPVPA